MNYTQQALQKLRFRLLELEPKLTEANLDEVQGRLINALAEWECIQDLIVQMIGEVAQ